MACGFTGDENIYGVGIRVGYYAQITAIWFANYFLLSEAKALRAVNKLFLFALLVAGSIYAYNARTTYAVEAFLLLQIFLCVGFVSIMEATKYNTRLVRRSEEGLLLRVVIMNAGLIFSILFWWRGLDVMKPTPCRLDDSPSGNTVSRLHSGTYACYLIRTNLYTWMRMVMKVLSLVAFLWTSLTASSHDVGELIQNIKMKKTRKAFVDAASKVKAEIETEDTKKRLLQNHTLSFPYNSANQTQKSSHLPRRQKTTKTDPAAKVLFKNIHNADLYLNKLFLVRRQELRLSLKSRRVNLFGQHVRFFTLALDQPGGLSISYATYLHAMFKSTLTNKPPVQLRWRVMLHMIALGQYLPWHWPYLLRRMTEMDLIKDEPPWRVLTVASDIQLSQIPICRSAWVWVWMAFETFIIIIFLIVQVELTIIWNNVSLSRFASLGQLIPFLIGVGGLVNVLWTKWCLVRKGVQEASGTEHLHGGTYETAIDSYVQWKRELESLEKRVSPLAALSSVRPRCQSV
ncbi:MAG: hypothetical protein Q9190_003877 [Brigantiaea leucoxantha]